MLKKNQKKCKIVGKTGLRVGERYWMFDGRGGGEAINLRTKGTVGAPITSGDEEEINSI